MVNVQNASAAKGDADEHEEEFDPSLRVGSSTVRPHARGRRSMRSFAEKITSISKSR